MQCKRVKKKKKKVIVSVSMYCNKRNAYIVPNVL